MISIISCKSIFTVIVFKIETFSHNITVTIDLKHKGLCVL